MKNKTKIANIGMIIFIAFALLLIGACVENSNDNNKTDNDANIDNDKNNLKDIKLESSQKLKKISDVEELNNLLKEVQQNSNNYNTRGYRKLEFETMDSVVSTGAPMAEKSASNSPSSASDYSTTNIQVAGVDEPDFVKNDDKYIYMIVQNKLVIVNAYPAENAKLLSETKINGTASNIFLNKDKLIIFVTNYEPVYVIQPYDYYPTESSKTKTHALVYDISDRENPELINDYDIDGYYYDARMIGDNIYFIAQEYAYYGILAMPEVRSNSKVLVTSEIYYFDNPENSYDLYTVA